MLRNLKQSSSLITRSLKLNPIIRNLSVYEDVMDDYTATDFEKVIQDKYTPGNLLGVGSFGNVYQAIRKKDGEHFAIKAMKKEKCPYAKLECELLSRVNHPNVLKFVEMLETRYNIYLVTELLKGPELFDVLVNRDKPFDEGDTLILVEQMLLAIEACHKNDFAHIDVKIENMVFREPSLSSPLVLVDFGAAQKFVRAPYAGESTQYIEGLDDEIRQLTPTRPAGTKPYNSPEVLNGFFSSRSDVWSVGVSMYLLLTGRRPFESLRSTPMEAERSIAKQIKFHGGDAPTRRLVIPDGLCSPQAQLFLERLTMGNPKERMSATEAIRAIQTLPLFRKDRKVLATLEKNN